MTVTMYHLEAKSAAMTASATNAPSFNRIRHSLKFVLVPAKKPSAPHENKHTTCLYDIAPKGILATSASL